MSPSMATVAQALASEVRVQALVLLATRGELRMGTLASELAVAPSTLTFHVDRLLHGDLVDVQTHGATRIVRLKWPEVSFRFDSA